MSISFTTPNIFFCPLMENVLMITFTMTLNTSLNDNYLIICTMTLNTLSIIIICTMTYNSSRQSPGCSCSEGAVSSTVCDPQSGDCPCLPNTLTPSCDRCDVTSYGFSTSTGCTGKNRVFCVSYKT